MSSTKLNGESIIQEKAAFRKIFAIFSSDKKLSQLAKFWFGKEEESSNLLLLDKNIIRHHVSLEEKSTRFSLF